MIKILKYWEVPNVEIFARVTPQADVAAIAADIIAAVRKDGDKALKDYTKRFDGVDLDSLQVSREAWDQAVSQVEPEFVAVLERAAENIRAFHSRQVRNSFVIAQQPGIILGQKVTPIEKVGLSTSPAALPPTPPRCSWTAFLQKSPDARRLSWCPLRARTEG